MERDPDNDARIGVGQVIAETYEIARLIGRGGMGAVWEAHHTRLPGKRVAIKVLHAEVARDAEALARFRREAEIASRLGHPSIVEVLDFNTLENGAPYLVLELLEGESLGDRLERGPVTVDDATPILRQIGSGLAAAHRESVVHRDLKPHNLFLCPREVGGELTTHVKILDFGISKIRGSQTIQTQEAALLGTPQYMAPEQATGNHAAVDARTDIFALGAIAYEMLTGQPAFAGPNVPAVVFKVVYESPRPLAELAPAVPAHVVAAIERALAKEPDARFDDMAAFVEAISGKPLATLRGGTGAPARPARATDGEALAATVASGEHADGAAAAAPMPEPPGPRTPSAATVAESHRQRARNTGGDAFAHTVATGSGTLDVPPPRRPRPALALGAVAVALGAAVALLALGGRSDAPERRPAARRAEAAPPALTPATGAGSHDAGAVPARAAIAPAGAGSAAAAGGASGEPAGGAAAASAADAGGAPAREEPPPEAAAPPADDAPDSQPARQPEETAGETAGETAPPEREAPRPRLTGDLRAAARALDAGDPDEALRLAQRAMRSGAPKAEAYAMIALAHCARADLSNALAAARNVPRRARRQLRRRCAKLGLELR